jgi:hypothetical protein
MAVKAPEDTGRVSAPPLDTATYPGRVLQIVDLGLQAQPDFKGQSKPPAQELLVVYELSDEFLQDEDGNNDIEKPRVISERLRVYSLSQEKAKSTQRYFALDPDNKCGGDFGELVGVPVNITIIQNPSKDGRVFNNVAGIAPMRAKDIEKLPELVNPPVVYDLDAHDEEMWEQVYPWVKEIIKKRLNVNVGDNEDNPY